MIGTCLTRGEAPSFLHWLFQDQTLAELQNNMMLVKMDLRKKAACIAEQFHTVQKLQAAPTSCSKKRFCANNENVQPRSQPPFKKPFLHNFLTCTTAMPAVAIETPYSSILRARGSPTSKPMAFGKKHWLLGGCSVPGHKQPVDNFNIFLHVNVLRPELTKSLASQRWLLTMHALCFRPAATPVYMEPGFIFLMFITSNSLCYACEMFIIYVNCIINVPCVFWNLMFMWTSSNDGNLSGICF